MPRHLTCIWIVLALSPISVSLAQTATAVETAPHHEIVPLTTMSLDGRVSGNPNKAGAQYVIRIPNDANQIVLPHWHPEDENIVVVKGKWYLGTGDKFDRGALREMNVGDYALVPKHMNHFAWSETDTIIQVHGIGPFQVIPVDSWDFVGGGKLVRGNPLIQDAQTAYLFRYNMSDRVRSKRGEGLIVSGVRSEDNKITQYNIQTDDGQRFYELEEELAAVPMSDRTKAAAMTGAWDGLMRGLPGGEAPCTFYVRQDGEKITGVLALPVGGAAFNSSTFRNNGMEIHMDTPVGKFLFNGDYRQGALSGTWSAENGLSGTWQAKKVASNR
jgi:quercetin dioxygenase-like cupin family protein